MEKISVGRGMLTDGAVWLGDEGGMAGLRVSEKGGGLDVTWLKERDERYLVFSLEAEAEHSVPVNLLVYSSREESGEPVFGIRSVSYTHLDVYKRQLLGS